MDVKFLAGTQLSAAIRHITAGKDVCCAVAFWGDGAAGELFGGIIDRSARIICDLSMGGTNPRELRTLGAPTNAHLRYRDGVHAKVYLSDRGVVIASANASDRGVGFKLEPARLIEAGVLAPHDESRGSIWAQAFRWFEKQWPKATKVDKAALARAQTTWDLRQAAARRGGAPAGGSQGRHSLFDVACQNPKIFDDIGFAFASTRIEPVERKRRLQRDKKEVGAKDIGKLQTYTDWGKDFDRWPERFFEIWKPKEQIYLYLRRKRALLPLSKPDTLYAEPLAWSELGPIAQQLGSRNMILKADEVLIRKLFAKRSSRFFSNGTELAAALRRLR